MPIFTKPETTGHDLLAEYSSAAEAFQAVADRIARDAQDRVAVIEYRQKELEAEKLITAQLADPPKVLVAPQGAGRNSLDDQA